MSESDIWRNVIKVTKGCGPTVLNHFQRSGAKKCFFGKIVQS